APRPPPALPPPPPPPPGPSINAYTMFDVSRYTSRAMRPSDPVGSPPASFVHVSPPSVDFQIPLPGPPPFMQQAVRRRWYSEANRIFGSECDITRSFAPVSSSPFSTCFHV